MKRNILNTCLLAFVTIAFTGCETKNDDHYTLTQPPEFPDILAAPSSSSDVKYLKPTNNVSPMHGIYYWLEEDYPADNTIQTLSVKLQQEGYVQIRWSPNDFAVYDISVEGNVKKYKQRDVQPEPLDEETAESLSTPAWRREQFGREALSYIYFDEWISPNDELVTNILTYSTEDDLRKNKLFVQRHFWPKGSRKDRYIQKYKELHPEQFRF